MNSIRLYFSAALICVTCACLNAQTIPGYIDFAPRDTGALPTDTLQLAPDTAPQIETATDPFNSYVPGLQSRYQLTLAPIFNLPHAHIPYLRRDRHIPSRPNLAISDWLYVDLKLGVELIFTDNVHRNNSDRQSDLILQTVLTIDSVLQLTDNFQLQVAGNLIYHRALGEDDVSGFGFQDYFYFEDTFSADQILTLNGNTLFAAQAGWGQQFGEWEARVGDRFYVANRIMPDPFTDDGEIRHATEAANLLNAALGRLLPGPSRLGMAAAHSDYWYDSRFQNYARAENSLSLWFDLQRETMRFQPYANYTIRHLEYTDRDQDGVVHQAGAGVRGPVTDQMDVEAGCGYSYVDDAQRAQTDEFLWRLKINHLMNSTTRHHLLLERRLDASAASLQGSSTILQYKIGHRFARDIVTWLGVSKTMYDDETNNRNDTERWSALANVSFNPAQRLRCTLEYQFIEWEADRELNDYTENRISFSATWDI